MTAAASTATDPLDRVIVADGSTGIYESHYLKANAPDGTGALWLKHNLLVPMPEAMFPPAAEFWVVLWEARDGGQPKVWHQTALLDEVTIEQGRVGISWHRPDVGEVRFDPGRASGQLQGDAPVSWRIDLHDELPPLRHFTSDWLYSPRLPTSKLHTPSPRLRLRGVLTVGDTTVDVSRWVGHRGHNWGSRHAHRYAYGSCNLWDDAADLTVDAFSAKVHVLGHAGLPWMTLVRGMRDGAPYGSGSAHAALSGAGWVEWPTWTAWGRGRGRDRVRLEMRLDPGRAVGLRYLHPDGGISYCYGVKEAIVELKVGGQRAHSRAGELEFLFPEPVRGIPLYGCDSLATLTDAAAGR